MLSTVRQLALEDELLVERDAHAIVGEIRRHFRDTSPVASTVDDVARAIGIEAEDDFHVARRAPEVGGEG